MSHLDKILKRIEELKAVLRLDHPLPVKDAVFLVSDLEKAVRALHWYTDGIYPSDVSEVKPGEFRNGKRARATLEEIAGRE